VESIGINPPLEIVAIEVGICGRAVSPVARFGTAVSSSVSSAIGAAVRHSGGSTCSGRSLWAVGSALRSGNSPGTGYVAVVLSTPVSAERIVTGATVGTAVGPAVGAAIGTTVCPAVPESAAVRAPVANGLTIGTAVCSGVLRSRHACGGSRCPRRANALTGCRTLIRCGRAAGTES